LGAAENAAEASPDEASARASAAAAADAELLAPASDIVSAGASASRSARSAPATDDDDDDSDDASGDANASHSSNELPDFDTPKAPPPKHEEWYGYQTLIADVATVGAWAALAGAKVHAVAPWGAVGAAYLVLPSAIHIAHGEITHAFASIGLRMTLSALGFLGGVGVDAVRTRALRAPTADELLYRPSAPVIGFFAGSALASVLDAAFLGAHTAAPAPSTAAAARRGTALFVAPTVAVAPSGGAVGLDGVF
jgi:hypothetical protein